MAESIEIVRGFLKDRMDIDPTRVLPETTLEELGIDSLMLLELLFEFEDKLGLDLTDATATPKTVAELLTLIEQFQAQSAAAKAG